MSERWRDSYDAWKLASPPDYDAPDEEEVCACGNTGWLLDNDIAVPCPECSEEPDEPDAALAKPEQP